MSQDGTQLPYFQQKASTLVSWLFGLAMLGRLSPHMLSAWLN